MDEVVQSDPRTVWLMVGRGDPGLGRSDRYRMFTVPGGLSGVFCVECTDPGHGELMTDSLTDALAWLKEHHITRHGGDS